MTPTQRTLAELRRRGYLCAITEHWNPHARRRVDLFGFIDILALGVNEVIAIQTTSGTNVAARLTKIREDCCDAVRRWLMVRGNRIQVWGWRKVKVKRGGKAVRWEARIEEVTL